jgi:Amt family ammonium transporter
VVSNFAAAIGSISWIITEMIIERHLKISLYGFCNGAIAGLACVTPAAGYISPTSSLIFGALCKIS